MAAVANPPSEEVDGAPSQKASRSAEFETKVSLYDQVSAFLVAGVILVGCSAALMFAIWLTRIITFKPRMPDVIPMELMGRGDHAEGIARDMEEPGVEELPDVQEPQLSDALEAMTDAITSTRGVTETFEGGADLMGAGKGQGDSRAAGPGGEGNLDVIPPWERWEIRLSTQSINDYAQQLDFFGIELGAINRTTPEINYLSRMSTSPIKRRGTRIDEKRLYFVHGRSGPLTTLSTQLLDRSGIDTNNKLLAQFYSPEAYQQLEQIELRSLGGRSMAQVRKTVFGVQRAGNGFQFVVERQDFIGG